jgi:hypothetical protein
MKDELALCGNFTFGSKQLAGLLFCFVWLNSTAPFVKAVR